MRSTTTLLLVGLLLAMVVATAIQLSQASAL